jgi:hypothetical protein
MEGQTDNLVADGLMTVEQACAFLALKRTTVYRPIDPQEMRALLEAVTDGIFDLWTELARGIEQEMILIRRAYDAAPSSGAAVFRPDGSEIKEG